MLAMEDVLSEVSGEELNEQGLPPGFRFHPTDEELITFYLASKVFRGSFCGVEIAEVDLNRREPWDLPDVAKMGEREWYFFSLRDRKYPTGLRTNRATGAGYWKATGKDREVYSASNGALIGMKKTLVFYKGRAPRGEKTKWVMHEYRLDGDFSYRHTCKEEWVICRIFNKTVEKKNLLFQDHSYILEASSSPAANSLHPLVEPHKTLLECHSLNSPFMIQHQAISDLKALINPLGSRSHLFPIYGFQPSCFSPTPLAITSTANENSPSPSILFKSLLSHPDCSLKQQASIPKKCKTDASFSHFQLPDAHNLHSPAPKIHQNPHRDPSIFEMDCSVLGFPAAADSVHEMSPSIAFNRAGFQMMLDPPITVSGESWPFDP